MGLIAIIFCTSKIPKPSGTSYAKSFPNSYTVSLAADKAPLCQPSPNNSWNCYAAADLAVDHDTRFNPEEGVCTCLLLRGKKYDSTYYSDSKNTSMEMLECIQDKIYDPIRETDAFVKLEARLKEVAKRREL